MSRVAITSNVATSFGGGGGGVYNYGANSGNAQLVVSQSTFSGNNGYIGGGAIYNDGSNGGSATLVLTNSTFIFNATGFDGSTILNAASGIGSNGVGPSATLANNLLKAWPIWRSDPGR